MNNRKTFMAVASLLFSLLSHWGFSYESVKWEAGSVDEVPSDEWITISLENNYNSPVIIATPMYKKPLSPNVIRIKNVTSMSFDISAQRCSTNEGNEELISANYIVVEEGVYTHELHGVKMESVKFTSQITDHRHSWNGEPKIYANNYDSPVVLGQVMSLNDEAFSVFWSSGLDGNDSASQDGLIVGKHCGEDSNVSRADEEVGYIVIESGFYTLNGKGVKAEVSSKSILGYSSVPTKYEYHGVRDVTNCVVSMASRYSHDGGWAVINSDSLTDSSVSLFIDEDQYRDDDRWHIAEKCSYLVFYNSPAPPVIAPKTLAVSPDEVQVSIESVSPTSVIHYTTDSSMPTGSSAVASETFALDSSVQVFSIAITPELSPSTVTQTEIRIDADAPEMIQSGLSVKYYKNVALKDDWRYDIEKMPSYANFPYYKASVVETIQFDIPNNQNFLASELSRHVGSQFTGYIHIPTDGFYSFYVGTHWHNLAILKINGEEIINKRLGKSEEFTVTELQAGYSNIEIDYYASRNGKLTLEWASDNFSRELVPMTALLYSPEKHKIIADDVDYDGDGVSDLMEKNVYLTQWNVADSDGDGLTDGEEILTYQTNALEKDTDGDGYDDFIESVVFASDALSDDFGVENLVAQKDAIAYTTAVGGWTKNQKSIISTSECGTLSYVFDFPEDDAYCLKVLAKSYHGSAIKDFDIRIHLDQEEVGRQILKANQSELGVLHFLLPYSLEGEHVISVQWDNGIYGKQLTIDSVQLCSFQGEDSDNNGIKDWVEKRTQAKSNLLDIVKSAVSPAFIEGRVSYQHLMSLNDGIQSFAGPGEMYYANIPLQANEVTEVDVSFENGVYKDSCSIEWSNTDVFANNSVINLRIGDSLLLTSQPEGMNSGSTNIMIGDDIVSVDFLERKPYTFSSAGEIVIQAEYYGTEGQRQSSQVFVVVYDFQGPDSPIACVKGSKRSYQLAESTVGLELDADPRLLEVYVEGKSESDRELIIRADANEPRVIAYRIGENGPIVGTIPLQGVKVYGAGSTLLLLKEVMEDGTVLLDRHFVVSPVVPDVSLQVDIFLSGVLFEDGSTRIVLEVNDFDETGEIVVPMLRTAAAPKTSACHHVIMLQSGANAGFVY
ncbi:MAG: hypothetical protein HQL32_02010 [Planctomycetes bacterium]|nr:hypothetical protein [Planctomycetota bacterium]